MFKRFLRSTSGNFALTFALASPAVLFAIGFGIDVTNMMSAKSDLQNALDAAVLAASRLGSADVSRKDTFEAFFSSNTDGKLLLRDPTATLDVSETIASIRNTGTAHSHVDLKFMSFFKVDPLITVTAIAFESRKNVEVALVLDNTGSMGPSNMKNLRDAANGLVDTLKGMKKNSTGRKIRAALVPFVTAVNVKGESYSESWIDMDAKSPLAGVDFDKVDGAPVNVLNLFPKIKQEWKGCVIARPAPYNLDDTAPDPKKPETLFVPYFAPDEPGAAVAGGNEANYFNNSYLYDTAPSTATTTDTAVIKQQKATLKSVAKYVETTPRLISPGSSVLTAGSNITSGPNRACATPIAPLTEDLDALKAQIDKMTFWNGSGTNVSEGLAWGRRVLSPGQPYTQAQPFHDEKVSKTIVVFTDGTNEVYGAGNTTTGSDYGSYGFLSDNRFGTTVKSKAVTQVNTWTSTMCEDLKKQDVQIFTILLGADTAANRTLYGKCASRPEYYFGTNDPTKLKAIFDEISSIIASLQFTG